MAFKRDKTLASAQKAVRKGQWDRAIKDYERIIAEDATDVHTKLKLADLYVKKDRFKEAQSYYRDVADHWAGQDIYEKAVAIYKQALRIAPDDPDLHRDLGEAYFRLGRLKDALRVFHKAQKIYKSEGESAKHRAVLESMVRVDPDDIGLQIQLAERNEKDGKRDEALELFRSAAAKLRDEGRLDEYVQVSERIVFLDRTSFDLRKEICRIYIGRGDNKRALKHLQVCFKNLPQDIETLELLGSTFHRLNDNSKALLVYLELAQVYEKQGDLSRANDAYKTILSIDPNNRKAKTAIGTPAVPLTLSSAVDVQTIAAENTEALDAVEFLDDDDEDSEIFGGSPPPPVKPQSQPNTGKPPSLPSVTSAANDFLNFAEEAIAGFDESVLDNLDEFPQTSLAESTKITPDESSVGSEDSSVLFLDPAAAIDELDENDQLKQYLTESEVFLKYGLLDRADDVISKVLQIDPNHLLGREQMRKLRTAQGDQRGAANQLVEMARILAAQNDTKRATAHLQRAVKLTGDASLVKSLAGSIGLNVKGDDNLVLADVSPNFIEEVSFGLDEISHSFIEEVSADPAVTGSREIHVDDAGLFDIDVTEDDFVVPGHMARTDTNVKTVKIDELEMDDDAIVIDSEVDIEFDSSAFDDEVLVALDQSETETGNGLDLDLSADEADAMFDELFGGPASSQNPSPSIPGGVDNTKEEAVMGEIDFYLGQGLLSEAEDALEKFEETNPGHNGISARRSQLTSFREGQNPFGATSLTSAFSAIESPNAASDPQEEFNNTHYELGVTYFEMGLFADAMDEFKQATDDPDAVVAANYHIALCQLELGETQKARTQLEAIHNDSSIHSQWRLYAGEKLAQI